MNDIELRMKCFETECDAAWWTNIIFRVDPAYGICIAQCSSAFDDLIEHHREFPKRTGHNTGVLRLTDEGAILGTLVVHRPDADSLISIIRAQTITHFGDKILRSRIARL